MYETRWMRQKRWLDEVNAVDITEELLTKSIVRFDDEIKLEPIGFREKLSQFYLKKGMNWSVSVVIYRECGDYANIQFSRPSDHSGKDRMASITMDNIYMTILRRMSCQWPQ